MEEVKPLINDIPMEVMVKSEPIELPITNGLPDIEAEDLKFYTQTEVDNTRKCLENTRLIIKDFETQLDWHLQQYMTLRNLFNPQKNSKQKRQDLLNITSLSALIANHPEGNKNFIKRRRGPARDNGIGKKKGNGPEGIGSSDSDPDDFDESDLEDEESEEEFSRKSKGKKKSYPIVKDEIDEEIHELVVPKEERGSEDEISDLSEPPPKKSRKVATTPKKTIPKSPAKRAPRGKKGVQNMATVDLTDKQNSLVEIKDEHLDHEELQSLVKSKLVTDVKLLHIKADQPTTILTEDDAATFDFKECINQNVIITYDNVDTIPQFVYTNQKISSNILAGFIKLVQKDIYDSLNSS